MDEARRYFVEDMAYSQALTRIGYVKGVGDISKEAPRMNLMGDPIYTDGLRAVLFFGPRPSRLSDIEVLDWEVPSAYPKKRNRASMVNTDSLKLDKPAKGNSRREDITFHTE